MEYGVLRFPESLPNHAQLIMQHLCRYIYFFVKFKTENGSFCLIALRTRQTMKIQTVAAKFFSYNCLERLKYMKLLREALQSTVFSNIHTLSYRQQQIRGITALKFRQVVSEIRFAKMIPFKFKDSRRFVYDGTIRCRKSMEIAIVRLQLFSHLNFYGKMLFRSYSYNNIFK